TVWGKAGNCTVWGNTSANTTVQVNSGWCNVTAYYAWAPAAIYANLTVLYGTGGTATGNATNFAAPANRTINATPSVNYTFSIWAKAGNCTVWGNTSANTTVQVDSGWCNVTASFAENQKANLTALAVNGTASGNSSNFYVPANKTLTSLPLNSSYSFLNWTTQGNCSIASATSANTTTEVRSNCNVTARYYWNPAIPPTGNLTVLYGTGGNATGNATGFLVPANQTINATPSQNYTFNTWSASGNCSVWNSSNANTTVQVNSGWCNVTASFTENPKANLTVLYGTGGNATGNSSNFYVPANRTINATASVNYSFSSWSASGNCSVANSTRANTTVQVNSGWCNVTASFASTLTNLTVLAGAGGSANGSATGTPPFNASVNATPSLNYAFRNWTLAGNCTVQNATQANTTVTVLSGNCNATASFNFSVSTTIGNGTNITNEYGALNISINGSGNSSLWQDAAGTLQEVNISSGLGTVLLFYHNFSLVLNFSALNITNGTQNGASFIIIQGVNASGGLNGTKTAYINGAGDYTHICVLDSETGALPSSACTGAGEVSVACSGTASGITCAKSGTTLAISGLAHSSILQYTPASTPVVPSGGNSGGGGGGGSSAASLKNTTKYVVDIGTANCTVSLTREISSTTAQSVLTATLKNTGGSECDMADFEFAETIPLNFSAASAISFIPPYSSLAGQTAIFSFPSFNGGESKTISYTVGGWVPPSRVKSFELAVLSAARNAPAAVNASFPGQISIPNQTAPVQPVPSPPGQAVPGAQPQAPGQMASASLFQKPQEDEYTPYVIAVEVLALAIAVAYAYGAISKPPAKHPILPPAQPGQAPEEAVLLPPQLQPPHEEYLPEEAVQPKKQAEEKAQRLPPARAQEARAKAQGKSSGKAASKPLPRVKLSSRLLRLRKKK
ncbi:MAG: hypothetical protein WC717_05760, partial [Candidatus Micrarchaeia archaeon]